MTTEFVKTNHNGYVKDNRSGAIINKNMDEYNMYLSQKQSYKDMKKLQNEVQSMKSDLDEIKTLLLKALNK
jgi:hypothetical protein